MPDDSVGSGSQGTAPVSLPKRGSKDAPFTFKGGAVTLKSFFEDYETMCRKYKVPEAQWKDFVQRYMSTTPGDTFEAVSMSHKGDWEDLKARFLRLHNSRRQDQKNTKTDLTTWVKSHYNTRIDSWEDFNRHARKYIRIAEWLQAKDIITEDEKNRLFWSTFSKDTKNILEGWILHIDPKIDRAIPYPFSVVEAAVDKAYDPRSFDRENPEPEGEIRSPSDDEGDLSDEGNDTEDDKETLKESLRDAYRAK
ncbi:hypothetical protein SISNIDRAFT_498755 [Sistotremastrum niveocremeum HHB9708]|uniref:Uncharacterized protein n=1 Tax=Sistotremastrum niveocremeum HHB9708 TaxID=1314777 RepID=A0A164MHJ3_9AGAM|nr:hypothetical protein SISNIDRAFT_498755 [Sistotremastrum niveocremeum HHB9708]